MLGHLLEQLAILIAAIALLGVPGASLVSLLRIRAALPDALAVPAGALLGSLVVCVATALQLATSSSVVVAVAAHAVISLTLAAAAVLVRGRRREAGATGVVPVARGWGWTTTAIVVVGVVFAWVIRGSIRLDALYHVALSWKLVELSEPTFGNVNRFADGGPNPAYALPGWHAFVGWTGWLTGSDPIIAWEIMPVLVVALGALAAGGLAQVLLERRAALPAGAFAWVLMRELFARREVDGDAIAFGAVPGQVTFELALPVALGGIVVAMRAEDRRVRRAALAAVFAGIVATVVYHANYLPYIAVIGLGYAAWWFVDRDRRGHDGRSLLVVGGWVAGMSVACMAVVLPLLASLENFGNAPEGDRIDYHLAETLGMAHVRGGHAFEMLGLPGMVALLAAPWLAWRVRASGYAVVSGGLLALLTFSFVPPLFQVLRATGSLTLLLRINHAIGVLLVVAFAALVLELADVASGWSHRRRQAWGAALVAMLIGSGVVLGYDRFMTDWPGYVAWVGLLGVFVALAARSRRSISNRRSDTDKTGSSDQRPAGSISIHRSGADESGSSDLNQRPRVATPGMLVAATVLVLALGLALPVGAISIRRALENMDDVRADGGGLAQGDLRCLGGPVLTAMQKIPAGSVVLSDPVASFRAMAVAPVYVVGDYKVWNAATTDNRAEERLASINQVFDSSVDEGRRLGLIMEQSVDYLLVDIGDGRWVEKRHMKSASTEALERAWLALDRFADVQAYDGGGVTRLLVDNSGFFEKVAVDDRADEAAIPESNVDVDAPCNSYGLWRVRHENIKRSNTVAVPPGAAFSSNVELDMDR